MPWGGYVEVGLQPESDGYGNSNLTTRVIISSGLEWLSIKGQDIDGFFVELGRISEQREANSDSVGLFEANAVGEGIQMGYTEEECEKTTLYIERTNVDSLIQMAEVIHGCIESIGHRIREMAEAIDALAVSYSENVSKILRDAEIWFADELVVEMAINHFTFFQQFVKEYKKSTGQNVGEE